MEYIKTVLNTFFQLVALCVAAPPRWIHVALYRSIDAYMRHAPLQMGVLTDFIGGWEGKKNSSICHMLDKAYDADMYIKNPDECDDRIHRFIESRVTVLIAFLVVLPIVSTLYKFPETIASILSFLKYVGSSNLPAKVKQNDAQKAQAKAARQKLVAMRDEYPVLKNFTRFFQQTVRKKPKMTIQEFWNDCVQPDLKSLIPKKNLDDEPVAPEHESESEADEPLPTPKSIVDGKND